MTTVRIECDGCGQQFDVAVKAAGKRRKCRNCGGALVPVDSGEAGWEEEGASYSLADQSNGAAPPVTSVQTRRRKKKKKPTRQEKPKSLFEQHFTLANGLRCVLVALFLHLLVGSTGLGGPVGGPILIGISIIVSFVGQAMFLKAPDESETRTLLLAVLGLQIASLVLRVTGFFWEPASLGLLLTSIAAFCLFVLMLRKLSEFYELEIAEMHANWILFYGGGVWCLLFLPMTIASRLGFGSWALMIGSWVITAAISLLCVSHYIDLLGELKKHVADE